MTPELQTLRNGDDVGTLRSAHPRGTIDGEVVVHLQTLGAASIRVGSARIGPGSARMFGALLFLAANRGRYVSRATLHALLFTESPGEKGLHSLRQLIYKLRQIGAPLRGDVDAVVLPERFIEDDYSGVLTGENSDALLDQIAGGFLPGFAPGFSEAYTDWLDQYRAEVTLGLRRRLVEQLAELRMGAASERRARLARACLALDPLNEEATLGLAEVLALSGSKAEAVQLLDKYLADVGAGPDELRVPATVLRRRIAERLPDPTYRVAQQAPMVGRDTEMQELGRYLRLAQTWRPQMVLISGEAGIGKSRLVSEFAKFAALEGALICTTMLQPHDRRRPMGAFMDLIPQLRELPGALGCSPETLQFLTALTAYSPLPGSQEQRRGAHANVLRATLDLLDAITAEVPLGVIIEDGQWADDLSLDLLSAISLDRKSRRLLTLLTVREAHALHASGLDEGISHLSLSAIDGEQIARLIDHLLGQSAEGDAALRNWFLEVAGGNPFFLQALVTYYLDTGERFSVPPSLIELLTKRLQWLDHRCATVFDVCALLGRFADAGRLSSVLGVPTLQLLESLRDLESKGFLKIRGDRLSCAHQLLADTAVQHLPGSVAALLHAKIGRCLQESAGEDSDPRLLLTAAEHLIQASCEQEAVSILTAAAQRSVEANQPQFAVEHYVRALELQIPTPQRVVLSNSLITVAAAACDWARVLEGIHNIRTATGGEGGVPVHDHAELMEYDALRNSGVHDARYVQRLIACATCADADAAHRIAASRRLFTAAEDAFDLELAERAYYLAGTVASELSASSEWDHLSMLYHTTLGDHEVAQRLARSILARTGGAHPRFSAMRFNAIKSLWRCGALAESRASAIAAYHEASADGIAQAVHAAAALLALFAFIEGDTTDTHQWLTIAEASHADVGFRRFFDGYTGTQILLALRENRPADALDLVDRLVEGYPAMRHTLRYEGAIMATRIRIRQLKDLPPGESEDVDMLLSIHERAASFGAYDDVMALLWYAVAERDGLAAATDLLRDYLTRLRRDGFPPMLELREILTLQAANQ